MSSNSTNRRDFLRAAGIAGPALAAAGNALGARTSSSKTSARAIGANDRINIGIIGCGGRGTYVGEYFARIGKEGKNPCQIVSVCDVYQKRVTENKKKHNCDGTLDYREVISRKDVDAVIVATPDHWHAKIALEAMDHGKDVYLEKPMCHTIEEAQKLVLTVKETGRILQVGSQTTSADQWWKAKKAIADGMIGKMIMSQGSYHRNSVEGEWNWDIDKDAGPEAKGEGYIDWKTWLGPAPKRPWDADRFFRFRKFWDYSGGIATDLFYHVVAPLNICWSKPQFPHKVMASGGIFIFKDTREVPDTFHLLAEYSEGHSLVLSSSMANRTHIPGTIRGHEGTIVMVEHGQFESPTEHIIVRPETVRYRENGEVKRKPLTEAYKFGTEEIKIPIAPPANPRIDAMLDAHIHNFLSCMRSREKPHLDVETGACAQVVITMAVESFRQGKVLYFDERKWKVTDKPVRA
jgi:predicted dehydrogenase